MNLAAASSLRIRSSMIIVRIVAATAFSGVPVKTVHNI